jgi:hypothetical protein
MANWKKLIVSGSVAELAAVSASVGVLVGTNQQIQPSVSETRLSGSFSGSFAGDGSGLTGVTATPTFPSTALTDITNSTNTKFFINDDAGNATSGNKQITWENLLTDIAGTNLSASSDSVSLNPTITGLTSVSATSFSGSFSGSFQGDGSGLTGIAAKLAVSGSDGSNGTVDLKTQALTVTGTSNEIETAVSGQTVTIGLPNDVTIGGDLTVSGNDIKMSGGTTALTFSGAGDVAVAGDLKVTGNDIKSSTGTTVITLNSADATVSGSLTVSGNLIVNGTTTTLDTTNLLVEDKFALFASGSDTNTDGGIVVQQGGSTGYALGVDASADRWALQNNTSPTATSITPDAYMGVIQEGTANPASNPVYGGATGYGTIFVDSNTGNIWIYS